jgi:hypothetical protein
MYISLTIFLFRSDVALIFHSSGFVEIESKEGRKTAYSRHKTASTNDGLPEISNVKYRNRIPDFMNPTCRLEPLYMYNVY